MNFPDRLYEAYAFDLDGTIYLGDHLLPGAKRMIEELRRRDIPVRFLSNNPTRDPQQYVTKLAKLGLPTPITDIVNTVVTTVNWLKEHRPNAVLYPIAEQPLIDALVEAGFEISDDPAKIDVVIASYDRMFEYKKLQIAFDALWFYKRAELIQTNPDRFCPFPGGRGEPDCAAIVAAIEACTSVKCSANLGKPSPLMLEEAFHGLDIDLSQSVMSGDRLHTDIEMAVGAGMKSAMVLTGESTMEDVEQTEPEHRPSFILDRIDRLIPASVWDELGWTEENDPIN